MSKWNYAKSEHNALFWGIFDGDGTRRGATQSDADARMIVDCVNAYHGADSSAVVRTLKRYNDWRLGAEIEQPDPKEISRAIIEAISMLERMVKPIRNDDDYADALARFGEIMDACQHNSDEALVLSAVIDKYEAGNYDDDEPRKEVIPGTLAGLGSLKITK